jgi:hypothetical protein
MSRESSGRVVAQVPAEILDRYETALKQLISESAPYEKVGQAYAELVYLRVGCNKVRTAQKLAVDRRTIHRWLEESPVEDEVRRWRAAKPGAIVAGQPVRVVGPDPESEERTVVQLADKSFQSVPTAEIDLPGEP